MENPGLDTPNWNNCVNVGNGEWWKGWSNGESYSYGLGVKSAGTIGFDMFSEKQYSNSYKLMYKVTGGNKKMCGNNTFPLQAKKVQERIR